MLQVTRIEEDMLPDICEQAHPLILLQVTRIQGYMLPVICYMHHLLVDHRAPGTGRRYL